MKLVRLIHETFAPLLHLAYAALWFLSLGGALCLVDRRALRLDAAAGCAIASIVSMLFFLRLADELKDLDYDRVHHPARPLVRGLVTPRDLARYMLGVAAAVLLSGFALAPSRGLWPLAISALDLGWGAGLIALERRWAQLRDDMFVNLLFTYPVQILISLYVYTVVAGLAGPPPSAAGLGLIGAFACAFLHYELARKTVWPALSRPGERLYSGVLGAWGAWALALTCAVVATGGVLLLLAPWRGDALGYGVLVALLPVAAASVRFARTRSRRVPLAGYASVFLVLFYASLIASTHAASGSFYAWLSAAVLGVSLALRLALPGATPERVASLYYTATESLRAGDDSMLFELFEPLEPARVQHSYERWIRARAALRVRWAALPETRAFAWVPLTAAELELQLAQARQALAGHHSLSALDAGYTPPGARLPCRLFMIEPRCIAFVFDHAFCNGYSAAFWFDDFLRCYRADGEPELPAVREQLAPAPGPALRLSAALRGLFWVGAFFVSFFAHGSARSVAETVDLSRGRRPPRRPERGYTVHRLQLDATQTQSIVRAAHGRGLTFGEAFALELVRLLFEAQPDKQRVLVSLPIDLLRYTPGVSRAQPGNFTGSVCVQFFRARPLEPQLRRAFSWARRGVPYWLVWLFGRLAPSELALHRAFATASERALAERGPYDDHSCAFSNLATSTELAELHARVRRYGGHSKTQTLFVSATRIHANLSVECCFSNDLFDKHEVLALLEALPARLAVSVEAPAEAAAGWRRVPRVQS